MQMDAPVSGGLILFTSQREAQHIFVFDLSSELRFQISLSTSEREAQKIFCRFEFGIEISDIVVYF